MLQVTRNVVKSNYISKRCGNKINNLMKREASERGRHNGHGARDETITKARGMRLARQGARVDKSGGRSLHG